MPDERGLPRRRSRRLPRLSTKQMHGFAISIAQQFNTSFEHIMGCMAGDDVRVFRLNLLTGAISPARYDYYRNRCLTDRISGDARRLLWEQLDHVRFVRAELVCELVADDSRWQEKTRVFFEADDGRRWSGGYEGVPVFGRQGHTLD